LYLFVGNTILKAINKIQSTNHLTFKECGKKGGRKEKRGGRKEKRGGRKEKTTPCPPPRISKKNRQHKEKVQTDKQHIYVLGYRFCYFPRFSFEFWNYFDGVV
jgi:hypothetical protein